MSSLPSSQTMVGEGVQSARSMAAAVGDYFRHRRATTLRQRAQLLCSCAERNENSSATAGAGLSLIWPRRRCSPRRPLYLVGSRDSDRGLSLRPSRLRLHLPPGRLRTDAAPSTAGCRGFRLLRHQRCAFLRVFSMLVLHEAAARRRDMGTVVARSTLTGKT